MDSERGYSRPIEEGVGDRVKIPPSLPAAKRQVDLAPSEATGTPSLVPSLSPVPLPPSAVAPQSAQADPALPPSDPASQYLTLLAQGHNERYALSHASIPDADADGAEVNRRAFIENARRNKEFASIEALLLGSLYGNRPGIAKALLEHRSLSSVANLIRVADAPETLPRDKIRADVALLDHGPLAPRTDKGAGAGVSISAGQVSMLVLGLSPAQLQALASQYLPPQEPAP